MTRPDDRRRHAESTLGDAIKELRDGEADAPAHFRAIVESALHAIALLSPDGVILEANARAEESLQIPDGAAVGTPLWEAPPWSAPEVTVRLRASVNAAARGATVRHEVELGADGSGGTVDLSVTPIAADGGKPVLIVAEWIDVTDRRDRETALRESEQRFHQIVAIAADAIISIDETQRITLFNQGAEKIFGYAAQEVIGEPLEMLMPRDLGPLHAKEVRAFGAARDVSRKMGERRQIFGRRKNGEVFNAEASISKGTVGGKVIYTAVMRDVTERWAADQEKTELLRAAERARDAAQRAARQRDEMLAIVSHDLRNPLSAIAMCALGLSKPDTPEPERLRLAETIHESVEWTQRLIEDLLDIASIEAGNLSIERARFDPMIAIARVLSVFDLQAADRGIELRVSGAEHLPMLDADPERLLQVLSNLIGNAMKFTPLGGTVTLGAESSGNTLVFSVRDTGSGIDPSALPRVFDRHFRVGSKEGGRGLGLAIARGIVEAHGGRIWIASEPGQGTVVQFSIPLPATPSKPA